MNQSAKKVRRARLKTGILPQIVTQSVIVILTALCSFIFMTWIVTDIFLVRNTYVEAAYEMLGTMVMMIVVLVPWNAVIYQRRIRELVILSEAIQKVVGGDYTTKISIKEKSQMKPIYEDFNKMCAELESVQILRNDFINNYSHEFKTPIASINGFASLLLEKELSPEEQRQYLEIIVDESARLSNLASNTILLSKLSTQQIVTDIEEYDLSEQLRQCSIILSHKWLEKHLEFECDFSKIRFRGNKEMMQHLWLNLLDNAIKYTPDGGEITVKAYREKHFAVVQVEDTGEGISEENKKQLFNPYFQGDSSHSRQGLGLGLAIAKRIVELCGGTITVQSPMTGGSIFAVKLPIN